MPDASRSITDLLTLARRHGLELRAEDARLDVSGLDFIVLHASDQAGIPWVVRHPRRPEVVPVARAEGRTLNLVAAHLPVAVPDWRVHGDDLIAYPRLAGTPALTVGAGGTPIWHLVGPGTLPGPFLASFARALAALQSVGAEAARAAGVAVKDLAHVRASCARTMEATRTALQPSERVWARWQRWLDGEAGWPAHLALVHGDLHPGHLLLDDHAAVVGILDWTEASLTDPSVDLAMFHGCFGPGALAALLPHFESAGGTTWPGLAQHAAERWASFPALGAEWALRTGNQGVLAFARAQLAAVEQDTPG